MKRALSVLVFISLAWGSCKTTHIDHSWAAPGNEGKPFKKLLVIGMMNNQQVCERVETHLTDDLRSMGYNAVSEIETYGPRSFTGLNEKQIFEKISDKGIDAIITIVLLHRVIENAIIPGKGIQPPIPDAYNRFFGYYSTTFNKVYSKDYFQESSSYFYECNLYDVLSQKLIYSVQTTSINPVSIQSFAHEYGKFVVKDMLRRKVIGR